MFMPRIFIFQFPPDKSWLFLVKVFYIFVLHSYINIISVPHPLHHNNVIRHYFYYNYILFIMRLFLHETIFDLLLGS